MSSFQPRVEIPGTAPEPLRGSQPREEGPDPGERITVTVAVRSRAGDEEIAAAVDALAKRLPHERPVLSHEEHERRYGSTAEDLEAVQAFAAAHGLQVVEASAARRVVELSGPLEAFSRAFGVRFQLFDSPARPYRTHDGPVAIPRELAGVVEDVIGLDDRPLMHPHASGGGLEKLTYVDPRTIAAYYEFPSNATGAGQCIAVLQFGGGYYQSDLETYFRLRGLKTPETALVELLGQCNQPADRQQVLQCAEYLGILPSAADSPPGNPGAMQYLSTIECTMDLELLGTLAPGARLVTYLAPGTPQGQLTAFSKAIFDQANAPSVINCSWGWPERNNTPSFLLSLDKLFQHAALKGVTICASAGDTGDGTEQYGKPTPQFPASSPHVLACGGSSVSADLSRETSWYETFPGRSGALSGGYGYSQVFPIPSWQKEAGTGSTNRAYPDVASKADIMDGYDVVVTGLDLPMGGTSAAAPMWAALAALINERLGRPVGLLGPSLYTKPFAQAVRDITLSGGGPCTPAPGWNLCTGLGSPVGTALLAALTPAPQGPGSA
jgi:kumamolisin